MKKRIRLNSLKYYAAGILTLGLFSACSEDNEDPLRSEPSYEALSVQMLQSTRTPYQHFFNPAKSALVADLKNDDLADIQLKLEEIFPEGKIDDIEEDVERGLAVWEIEVYMNADDDEEIEFYISKDLLEVVKIEGDGPVNYDINPGGEFISLTQAINAVMQSVDGTIDDWDLEYDGNRWIYEFEYETVRDDGDDDIEIHVDAYTADVLGIYHDDIEDDNDDDDSDDDSQDDGDDDDGDDDNHSDG